jgi:hypothetical protein
MEHSGLAAAFDKERALREEMQAIDGRWGARLEAAERFCVPNPCRPPACHSTSGNEGVE